MYFSVEHLLDNSQFSQIDKSNSALYFFALNTASTVCNGQLTWYWFCSVLLIVIDTSALRPLIAVCIGVIANSLNFLSLSLLPYAPSKCSSFVSGVFSLIESILSFNISSSFILFALTDISFINSIGFSEFIVSTIFSIIYNCWWQFFWRFISPVG